MSGDFSPHHLIFPSGRQCEIKLKGNYQIQAFLGNKVRRFDRQLLPGWLIRFSWSRTLTEMAISRRVTDDMSTPVRHPC